MSTRSSKSILTKSIVNQRFNNLFIYVLELGGARSNFGWLSYDYVSSLKSFPDLTFKVLQGSAPKYLIDLICVLPPSRYDLRRNEKGILLSTPKRFTKVTMGIDLHDGSAKALE